MFARRGHVNTYYLPSVAFYQALHIRGDFLNVRFVEPPIANEDVQLIERRFFAELDQRSEIDVAVDDVLHARLRLAHVVNAAADH